MRNLSRATIILSFLLFAFSTHAANLLDVVINEIAWMGTVVSYNDEWIELYNNTDSEINLSGWKLSAKDGTPEINLTGKISANGFYLLERTNDDTVPGISANQVYTGALGNKGENLNLYDSLGNSIDSVSCSSGWFAGDNSTKQTMERKSGVRPGSDPINWEISQNPGGTPKAKNSVARELPPILEESIIEPEPQVEPGPELPPQQEPKVEPKPIIYPSGIIINEILPSPTGPDETEEWTEIFNQNDFEVDLSDWKIEDMAGKITTFIFSKGTEISSRGFLVFSRLTTKITLNNDGDGLNLFQPDGKIVDSVSYEKAPRGQSYNRIDSKWVWSTILTPGSENIILTQKTEGIELLEEVKEVKESGKIDINTASVKELQKIAGIGPVMAQKIIEARPFYSLGELTKVRGISSKTLDEIKKQGLAWVDPKLKPPKIEEVEPLEKNLAAVAEPIRQTPKSLPVFLIALALAIFSGVIILILKKKLKSKQLL